MTRIVRALTGVAPLALALAATAAIAQPATNSKPQPSPIVETTPPPRDIPYPGTVQLAIDARDVIRGIVHVEETIPVAQSGPMTLLYPEWIPGNHSPTGPISKLDGLTITADGQPVKWVRDEVDVYAFHIDVPAGAKTVVAKFQYLSPTATNQGRIQATPELLSLQWDKVALYPAGYFVRDIPYSVTATYPTGWQSATALIHGLSGDHVTYPTVDFETLVDSPAIAGRYMKSWNLTPDVALDVAADAPRYLEATPEQIDAHKRLVEQAVKLFGAQHYDHYDFLFTLSDTLGGEGLEHHRSSEDGTDANYFTDWDSTPAARNLLPHEFTHSWNGKFRRPADLWTPDYRQPMGDSLLWVYEGQTQYWGYVLQARSGLVSKQDTLDALASVAAYYQNAPGLSWRSVEDTTNDPTMSERRPLAWRTYQRSEDYYSQGQLTWLDADQLIREKTHGKKSLDDFARLFFGIRDRDWGVVTYTFDDVVATLNKVMPYDWATFLKDHIYDSHAKPPLDWITLGGYKLVYTDTPSAYWKSNEKERKITDLTYSLGLTIGKQGKITAVQWGGPSFDAGITNGGQIIAVNGRDYDADSLKAAITDAKGGNRPIHLLVKQSDQYKDVAIPYYGGLKYPHLEKVAKGETGLDALLAPKK
ncbi:MAG TPA: peptidase M61 [Sphingomonas sp.]|nr:peptidase M61 [Sphingomonas sp.]